MKLLTELDSLDNVKDGETRKLITKTSSSGSGNVVSSVSVSGDTITYTKGITALTAHQNAFSKVKVGSTTVAADSAGDTLELVAGSNVTLTPDATNDKVTIAATDTTYTDGTAGYTLKAKQDGNGNVIADTYVTKGTEQTITGNKTFNGDLKMDNINKAYYTATNTSNIVPNVDGLANPPWNHDLWHDHFAFLRKHTIDSQEATTDGTTWTTTTRDLKKLFYEKDIDYCPILSASQLAFRFTLQSTDFAWSGLSWFEISTHYTEPFSNFTVKIEYSTDKTTWNKCHESTIENSAAPHFLRNGYTISANGYLRFTFTKTTNLTTGTVALSCIKGFCTRKGSQGLGIEYEYPYDWDYDANVLPIENNTKTLGSSSKKWSTVYATNFDGLVTKATGDKNGNDITTTYYKANNPNGYTSNTGTITKVQANGTDVASSGTANIPAATTSKYGVTELSSATNSTSETLAATPKAVKAAYDLAASKGTGTITGVSVNGTSIATSGVANITSVSASILSGAIPSAVTATTQSASDNSTKLATTAFVKTAIDNLPEPMVFKGSLGTGGTVTALPVDGSATVGDTYKVITAGTYASKAAKVGDTFICLTKTSSANTWELIPSGDEPSGTVTSITLKATSPIAIDSTSAITTSGTRTLSHANSGVTAGTYRSVTVNATGHVTAGTNPTTLNGYGITDAKIDGGVITLGSNTITPITDISGKLDKSGGAITGAITRSLASSGTVANTNLFTVSGSTDGFKVDYASTTADVGITTLSTTDDANAKISIGNTVSSTYKEAISVTNGSAVVNGYTVAAASAKAVDTSISASSTSANLPTSAAVAIFVEGKGYVTTDTKNTAGSTDTSSKIFLIGATSQAANPQTYSDNEVYATSGVLTTKSVQVGGTAATIQYNSTDKCIEFIFA